MIRMKLRIYESDDSHYFSVMAWKNDKKITAPNYNEKFHNYTKALKMFNKLYSEYGLVELYEIIGDKRKWLADSNDTTAIQ